MYAQFTILLFFSVDTRVKYLIDEVHQLNI